MMIHGDTFPKNDRREIFGWLMYDWANSAFYTTIITVLLGPYLTALAQNDVGKGGVVFNLGFLGSVTAESLVANCLAISVGVQIFFLPILGSIADYTHWKKKMMALFCYSGVVASSLLFFIKGDSYLIGCALMMFSNMCFAAANVFYNAFLVDLTTEDYRDRVSSYGYASGYVSGILVLLLNLALIGNAERLGIEKALAVRISMLVASLWWGAFGALSFWLVKTRNSTKSIPKNTRLLTVGFRELGQTFRELLKLRGTLKFLVAYLFYNDGIQTVILMSSVFLSQELFISKGKEAEPFFLIEIFLVAQVSALVGALAFERVARLIGAKRTIIMNLMIWCAIVIYAYGYLETITQAVVMSMFIGLVLGSTQALSRSLFSQMIPIGRESSFFGLYEISEKGTSWMGNQLFAIVVASTGSYRQAILALIFFFVVGSLILLFSDVKRAIHEAGQHTPEEAAHLHDASSA